MSQQVQQTETRFLRLPDVIFLTGLRKTQIYALAKSQQLLRPIKLSERCSVWPESNVRTWIAERIAAAEQSRNSGKVAA